MAHDRKFRFGVQVSQAVSAASWRDKARKIEDLGYSTLFMPDHFGQELAPLPAMAMAAAHTTTLRVGGAGVRQRLQAPGDPRQGSRDDRPALRRPARARHRRRLDEDRLRRARPAVRPARGARRPVRRGAAGHQGSASPARPFSVQGEHYRITDYASWPEPVQKPGPPILIGGGGKRVLSIAAREADIVGVNPNLRDGEIDASMRRRDSLQEQTDRKIEWIRDAAGARLDDIEIQMRFFVGKITDDRMGMAAALAPAFGVEPEDALEVGRRAGRQRERDHRAAATAPRRVGLCATSCSATTTSTSSPASSPSSPVPDEIPATRSARGSTPRVARAAPPRPA